MTGKFEEITGRMRQSLGTLYESVQKMTPRMPEVPLKDIDEELQVLLERSTEFWKKIGSKAGQEMLDSGAFRPTDLWPAPAYARMNLVVPDQEWPESIAWWEKAAKDLWTQYGGQYDKIFKDGMPQHWGEVVEKWKDYFETEMGFRPGAQKFGKHKKTMTQMMQDEAKARVMDLEKIIGSEKIQKILATSGEEKSA